MATRHRTFSFSSGDVGGIVDEMERFAADADGRRWLNIVPDADEEEIHTGSVLWRIFSSRGPVVPQLTWVPADPGRPDEPSQVGVAHATGRGAVERLAEAGVRVPDGWRLIQDHQKRGVVYVLEGPDDPGSIVTYGVGALRVLSPFRFQDAFLATFSQR